MFHRSWQRHVCAIVQWRSDGAAVLSNLERYSIAAQVCNRIEHPLSICLTKIISLDRIGNNNMLADTEAYTIGRPACAMSL